MTPAELAAELVTRADFARIDARLATIEKHLANIAAAQPTTWIPLSEAKRRLGVCDDRTLKAAAKRGDVVIKRVGRRILVAADSLRPVSDEAVAVMAREARG